MILSKDGEKTVVQAKKYSEKVSNKAIQEIVAAKNHYKAHKTIVVTNSSFTKSAIDLALSNNVELWDGLKLRNIIQNLKTKKKEKGLQSTQLFKLEKGKTTQKLQGICPFCEESFNFELDLTKRLKTFTMDCPNCGSRTQVNLDDVKPWKCEFCTETFYTEKEAEDHGNICNKRKNNATSFS